MKSTLALLLFAGISCHAGPADKIILAAMKLSEQPNYSWHTSVSDNARTYDIEGKTVVGSVTWVRLPMVKAIAQRLGREADTQIEAIFRGPDAVLRTAQGWQTVKELPKRHRDWRDDGEYWPALVMAPPPAPGSTWGRGAMGMDPTDPFPIILHSPPPPADDDKRNYSNAQFGVSHPHDELAIIVSSYAQLKAEADTVIGTLNEVGAQLLLVRDGQENISAGNAAGLFQLQIKNGMVVKYALRLEGILFVDRKKVHVQQVSTTSVTNVGATAFELPFEARRKIGL